jgi:hypothetical protein
MGLKRLLTENGSNRILHLLAQPTDIAKIARELSENKIQAAA